MAPIKISGGEYEKSMDREAWWGPRSPWGLKESDTTEQQTLINYVTNTEEKTPSVTSKRNMARVFRQAFLLHNPQPQALHPAGMSASILTLGQKCPETPWRQ